MSGLRKVMIVVEETGSDDGHGFNVYLAGDKERLDGSIREDDMSPAEFWGWKLFNICVDILQKTGAVKSIEFPSGKKGLH